jgi:2-polyprenyl-3-methyl-5-hydroxy-6-metoxy-1,4-benzoquinol methylase
MSECSSTCKLCGTGKFSFVQKGVRHGPEIDVRRCTHCGLVFLFPQPKPEELVRYYSELYRHEYDEPPVAQRFRTDLDEARTRVRRLLPLLQPKTRLLEVGSGSGALIASIRPYVQEVMGIEPDLASRTWIEHQLALPIADEVPQNLSQDEAYDLVVSFHVLEHVAEPVAWLIKLKGLLRRGGHLVIEVPNIDDMLVKTYKVPAYLKFYYQKAHLYYFSKRTLKMALQKAELDATIIGIQRYDLSNHLRWILTGQPGGQGYYHQILAPPVQAAYADSLIRTGRSDTLWAVARRKD